MNNYKSSRIDAVDLMKWVCAWMVVTIHTRPFVNYSVCVDLYISQGICRFAVPLFFSASGYLLFRKIRYPIITNSTENNKIIRKYILKTCQRYITWSSVYYLFQIQHWAYSGMLTKGFIINQIRLFFLEASYGHLWYLLAMIFAVPVVYLLIGKNKWLHYVVIAAGWSFRCLEYTYNWTGFLYEQFAWIHANCDLVANVLFCAIPMLLVGVLAIDGHKKYDNKAWCSKALFWFVVYFSELTFAFFLSKEKRHFEFLFTCPVLIYNIFCWVLTLDYHISKPFIQGIYRYGSEWIYYIHWLVILVFSLFSGDTGMIRFGFVCTVCLLTSIGYTYFETRRNY